MSENTIFEINVKIDNVTEVKGGKAIVYFVSFHGEVNAPIFTGKVISDAVDTQIHYENGLKILSARYILEGVDSENNRCRIFIENNGIEKDGKITTTPTIITDSPVLKYLETAQLSGSVISSNEDIIIKIFEENR